ncbi:glycosyltransferase family 9 protein [Pedobacter sp.]|uniref:glycosyltransferase family 9 protein n=1 Tax=Pedobacter sp. TaxID=1411316 RepID=UPI003D7F5844
MSGAAKILVIRFSAMGDVAMAAPVIREFTDKYTDAEVVMLSRALFSPFFSDLRQVSFHPFDPKKQHKGFLGLLKLFGELRRHQFTAVADLHTNLRSAILCLLFFLSGVKVRRLDKGRSEKKKLTRQVNKVLKPLKRTSERYADVFRNLGFPFQLSHQLPTRAIAHVTPVLQPFIDEQKTQKYIGVSPFAQHAQKVYPLDKMEYVVQKLSELGHKVLVFGGGPQESAIAEQWEQKYPNVHSVIQKLNLSQELDLISHLDVMVSMDSSGMHLASLKGIPVVSIWGATHPYAGFMGYGQHDQDTVQLELECRPCSIYGNKPCFRGDFACMNNLSELIVLNKVIQKLYGETTSAGQTR